MVDIFLRPLSLDDTKMIVKWRNSDRVRNQLFDRTMLTEAKHIEYFNELVATNEVVQYIIVAKAKGCDCPIGTVFFKNIDLVRRQAEIGLFIGEDAFLGRGYGEKALREAINGVFTADKLDRIYAMIMDDNHPSRRLFRKVGFREVNEVVAGLCRDGHRRAVRVELTRSCWTDKPLRDAIYFMGEKQC